MTTYTSGEWTIEKDQWGYRQGMSWGLWRGKELVEANIRTLKSAKRAAANLGQAGEWVKGKLRVEMVGG